MIAFGIILLILGLIFGIQILWIVGLVLLVIGIFFLFARPGGRIWY